MCSSGIGDPTPALGTMMCRALDLLLVTDVAGMCGGAGDVLGDLPGCGLVDVGHHDGGAGLAEALGDGLAETLACAGDDGDLALEFCGHAMTP
jgi:hypothetical protein